jgi:Tfp pilus assembly protein PilV
MRKSPFRKSISGVTLVEVILSLAIVSVALFTLLVIRNDNIRQADKSNALSKAEMYASSKIEDLVIDLRQHGRLTQTADRFGEESGYSWEAEVTKTKVQDAGEMWLLAMTVYYPQPEGEGKFHVQRLIRMESNG